MKYRNPLSIARGLGSSKDGLGHWWMQRLTAIALVPLVFWFALSIIALAGQDRAHVLTWMQSPFHGVVLSLFLVTSLYHANLGLQAVFEDYIQARWLQLSSRITAGFAAVFLGFTGVFALLRLVFGG
ncbi:MAG: succinate dehydrogenase, hydrophobic membrane anchor protein [Betaproteobacteria bacterium RIFCSPLOWO2_02_FULL_62_17]|nr:MAG: succinate dehydrogenase, hydrophobic membrane anchor protein [Betaproteobacteria bacterium RIFCSPLOWO2_02_FULL_62_17]